MKELPLGLSVAVAGTGLVLVAGFDRWRLAGLLVVRSRAVDAAVLLTLGFGLVALANTIPTSS